jgi:uncharacterized membrane protein YccC
MLVAGSRTACPNVAIFDNGPLPVLDGLRDGVRLTTGAGFTKKRWATAPAVVRDALKLSASRPNLAAGIRAALAATLPLLLIPVLGRPELTWASLAGFNTIMVDKGGAYRNRAGAMAGYAAVGSAAALTGTLASTHSVAAIGLVLVAVTAFGMLRLFGAAATSVGISASVALVIVLALPAADIGVALGRAEFSLAGSAWALAFSLVLWPIRPYRPARLAVATTYRGLAALAQHLATLGADVSSQSRAHDLAVVARLSIENARATLGALRRGRPGTTLRGEQLVVLLEGADQLLGDLVSMKATVDRSTPSSSEQAAARHLAARVADGLTELAAAIDSETPPREIPGDPVGPVPAGIAPHDARVLRRTADQLAELTKTARGLDGPASGAEQNLPELLVARSSPLAILRAHLTSDSAIFRHALRMSTSTAVAVLITTSLHVHRGYWTTLTCLVILQPHGSQTLSKALQRVGGTVLGAWVAVAAATFVHDPSLILLCVFVFITIAVALMPLNYGIFALFLTPSFVLLAERSSGEPGLASVRVVNTFIGAGIALLGSRLLFPLSERDLLRPRIAAALRSLRHLFDAAVATGPGAALKAARRDAGLALSNADASFQRALTESPPGGQENEALLSLILYSHRLAATLNGLARTGEAAVLDALRRSAPALDTTFEDLADAIASDRAPAPLPDFDALPDGITSDLAVQHVAVGRWHAARHPASRAAGHA